MTYMSQKITIALISIDFTVITKQMQLVMDQLAIFYIKIQITCNSNIEHQINEKILYQIERINTLMLILKYALKKIKVQ